MTSINSSIVKIDSLHDRVLEKASETLGQSGQNVDFSDRMKNALTEVADAQKQAADSMKASSRHPFIAPSTRHVLVCGATRRMRGALAAKRREYEIEM